ncbi:MAG: iron ABC transporter permease [Candidatus Methanoplasma sp.]|jgi:iron complex transport system permease protein|nr:iron ABC transporter permease [Candidatus Methanoplasma sp.]
MSSESCDADRKTAGREVYSAITGRKVLLVSICIALLFAFFIIDLMTGVSGMSAGQVLETLFYPDQAGSAAKTIVWSIRLPTALMAVLVGAALGMAGAEMQTILDNPLADPYTLGISTAAAFGAGLFIVFGIGIPAGTYTVPINAFAFSLLSCFMIYAVAKAKSADRNTIILTGIAMLFLFQSMVSLVQYLGSAQQQSSLLFWMFGSLQRATWGNIPIVFAAVVLIGILFMANSWKLTSLKLGDGKATSLGVNVKNLRRKILIGVSVLTSVAVSFTGTIGFVGLVGPHISRMLVGDDHRYFLPLSALMGAMLLSVSSTISKIVSPGLIFPIGIITSLVGVPFFMMLILKKRRAAY